MHFVERADCYNNHKPVNIVVKSELGPTECEKKKQSLKQLFAV